MPVSRSLKPVVLGCAAIPALFLAGCDRQSGKEAQPEASSAAPAPATVPTGTADRSHKGSALPDMTFANPSGGKLALASLKGKPVLVNLWATWCAPCIKELPGLDKLASSGKVRVVTVSQDSGEPQAVTKFLGEKGLKHVEPWLDPENELAFHYATGTLPTSVLYDSQGREVWRFVGEYEWTGSAADALIAEAK